MKTFLVGGAVRDMLLNHPCHDYDYVVIGASIELMLNLGYKQVGKDFPVFLDLLGNELALARTEQSIGSGYNDFTFATNAVTLEQDLMRRDLTINAIAYDQQFEQVIDPFGGVDDIKNNILRCVNPESFIEDPLRVLRLARFCAKFPDFSVDKSTLKLCQKMVEDNMLDHLTAERVGAELIKTLETTKQPSRFFYFLKMCGALKIIFPELDCLGYVPAGNFIHHPEGDAFTHTMQVLDACYAVVGNDPTTLFAAIVHDLGKGTTSEHLLPHHYGHEDRGILLVEDVCGRFKLPSAYQFIGRLVSKYHTHIHNFNQLNPKTIVKMFNELKCDQVLLHLKSLTTVSEADSRGRSSFYANRSYPNAQLAIRAGSAFNLVKARNICTKDQLVQGKIVSILVYKARIDAISEVLKQTQLPSLPEISATVFSGS